MTPSPPPSHIHPTHHRKHLNPPGSHMLLVLLTGNTFPGRKWKEKWSWDVKQCYKLSEKNNKRGLARFVIETYLYTKHKDSLRGCVSVLWWTDRSHKVYTSPHLSLSPFPPLFPLPLSPTALLTLVSFLPRPHPRRSQSLAAKLPSPSSSSSVRRVGRVPPSR